MVDLSSHDNLNILWSKLVCANLQRWGVSCVYVSPGYRNVPIIAALDAIWDMTKVVCVDERSAAYQALGYARVHGRRVLLVCTSGTAGANYLPALLEASQEQLPLIALTADRPFEMIYSGANQVIDQAGLFGGAVRRTLCLPSPSEEFSPEAVLAHVDLLMHSASVPVCGPVHLNMPLREPLERCDSAAPISGAYRSRCLRALQAKLRVPAQLQTTYARLTAEGLHEVMQVLQAWRRPLLIVGRLAGDTDHDKILTYQQRLGWPTFCDIGSSLKYRVGDEALLDLAHPAMRQLMDEYHPDGILHIGRRLVSKDYDAYIGEREDLCYVVVSPLANLQDVNHRAHCRLIMREEDFVEQIEPAGAVQQAAMACMLGQVRELHYNLAAGSSDLPLSLPWLATILPPMLGADRTLLLGNSSTIRAFDSWSRMGDDTLRIEANRGVSGIEGLVSTALGLTRGSARPVTAVIGDIAAIHDLNGFLQLAGDHPHPLIVIIVNDRGGGIFRAMPAGAALNIAKYLETPHTFEFGQLAAMSGCAYQRCIERGQLIEAYQNLQQQGISGVIEIVLDVEVNRHCHTLLMSHHLRSKV